MPYKNKEIQHAYDLEWAKSNGYKYQNANKIKRRAENKDFVQAHKLKHGCSICGYNKCAEALEFDHIDRSTKKGIYDTVSVACRRPGSLEKIINIINQCQLLCSNCHREKTVKHKDWLKRKDT